MAILLLDRTPPPPATFESSQAEALVLSESASILTTGGGYPNLPAGYTLLVRMQGDAVPTTSYAQVAGWTGYFIRESGTVTSQTDATAPLTPDAVWRTRFGPTLGQGAAPCNVGSWANSNYSAPTQYSGIYGSFRMKIGTASGFLNHPAGTKMGFFAYAENPAAARNQIYLLWKGPGGSSAVSMTASRFVVNQQSNFGGANRTMNPVGGDIVTTGDWHHVEWLMETNSAAGAADGILKVWVNGTQVHNVSDVVYKYSGATRGFFWYAWNPTWGGNVKGVTHSGFTDDILTDDYAIYGVL